MDDYRDWPYSSYEALTGGGETRLDRDQVLDWFGGLKGLAAAHQRAAHQDLVLDEAVKEILAEDDEWRRDPKGFRKGIDN